MTTSRATTGATGSLDGALHFIHSGVRAHDNSLRNPAQAVARELAQEGLWPAVVTGFGRARTVAGNNSEEGRA